MPRTANAVPRNDRRSGIGKRHCCGSPTTAAIPSISFLLKTGLVCYTASDRAVDRSAMTQLLSRGADAREVTR